MTDPRLPEDDELRLVFHEEAGDLLSTIDEQLLRLEQNPGELEEALHALMRTGHTFKGAAGAIGLTALSQLAHDFESCIAVIRDGKVEPSSASFEVLYASLDLLRAYTDYVCRMRSDPPRAIAKTIADVADAFGEFCELHGESIDFGLVEIASEDENDEVGSTREAGPEALLRVSAAKVDQLMAVVEDLVTQRVATGERQTTTVEIGERVEQVRGELASLQGDPQWRDAGISDDLLSWVRRELEDRRQLLAEIADSLQRLTNEIRSDQWSLQTLSDRLQDEVRAMRMVPASVVLQPFPRMIRDIAASREKLVTLEIVGGDTEVDRNVLESAKDALVHLVRNAIDHGIETPDRRLAEGKKAEGVLTIDVSTRGPWVTISVYDDGGGVDVESVIAAAVRKGMVAAARAGAMTEQDALDLIFAPGLSSAENVSEISGRGVGLDAVRRRAEELGGKVAIQSVRGRGTHFQLDLPVSRATRRLLLVETERQIFGVPIESIDQVIAVQANRVAPIDDGPAFQLEDGSTLAVRHLGHALNLRANVPGFESKPALVLHAGGVRAIFIVERLTRHEELVVKGLGDHLGAVNHILGSTILPGGKIVLVLDPTSLVQSATGIAPSWTLGEVETQEEKRAHRILVVDDSITARTLQRNILQTAGYDVTTASDGKQAIELHRAEPVELIVSDIEMPHMNGIELTRTLRRTEGERYTPVILVSSLGSAEDRRKGVEAGADSYIVKGQFNQDLLLETVARLLGKSS